MDYEKRETRCDKKHYCGDHNTITPQRERFYHHCHHHHPHVFCQYHNCCVGQCGCHHFEYGHECEPSLKDTNRHDKTKENLLIVDGAKDLLVVTSGVPSTQKTILTVKRDNTKKDLASYDKEYSNLLGDIETINIKLKEQQYDLSIYALKKDLKLKADKKDIYSITEIDEKLTTINENFNYYATLKNTYNKSEVDELFLKIETEKNQLEDKTRDYLLQLIN